ncbi:hypothetical protein OKW21_005033 [Catalinimonas alkaloidigena]|uniref:hypothetical protein n=1 Tax=Catalinimonas alkaloidigena TaxID=1075417 RepID=UPI0024065EA6|nr:hypothetical protein [Catalinimonas alkaloidigena]MDF9799770.1 hypothetical protein [Catalinimonas alkaloidigena]
MKLIEREIFPFKENEFFQPLRDKIDFARIIIYSARYLLLNFPTDDIECNSKIKLCIDKMSRLFFYKEKRYFSVSFPFSVQTDGTEITDMSTLSGKSINSKSLSSVVSILEDPAFKLNPSLTDYYIDSDTAESIGISILEEVFQSEPGYIRYDNDPENEDGKIHPLNHLDVNYSSYGTYKIGLDNEIETVFFDDILNIRTDCSFLK